MTVSYVVCCISHAHGQAFLSSTHYIIDVLIAKWALIELARHPEYQTRLRKELRSEFPTGDPTWDQLTYGLPFLDGVVHEILRLHPSVPETSRQASPSAES